MYWKFGWSWFFFCLLLGCFFLFFFQNHGWKEEEDEEEEEEEEEWTADNVDGSVATAALLNIQWQPRGANGVSDWECRSAKVFDRFPRLDAVFNL